MNIFVKQFLTSAIKILIGSQMWGVVFKSVEHASKLDISGAEKRAIVFGSLRNESKGVAKSFLNLAIEIAVNILKSKI